MHVTRDYHERIFSNNYDNILNILNMDESEIESVLNPVELNGCCYDDRFVCVN